jgi:hypothetical protein
MEGVQFFAWCEAMKFEMESIYRNNTWELVDLHLGQ